MLNSDSNRRSVKSWCLLGNAITFLLAILVTGGLTSSRAQDTWIQKTNFGVNAARQGAVGFSIGSKGYIGTGYGWSFTRKNDFWEYDPAANSWTQKADFGGTAREGAVGFSIGAKGYIGTGYNAGYKNDFWEYDPTINTWTQKADFGGTGRYNAVGFSIGTKGYIGTGYNGSLKNDFWEYDPSTDAWIQKADFGGTKRHGAVGFSIGSKGYIGTGVTVDFKKDFWEYDPTINAWTQKANFGGTTRYGAVGFSIGTKGYLGTGEFWDGMAHQCKDFWEYDPSTDTWTQRANLGGSEREFAAGFSIGNKGYLGTGCCPLKYDLWEYTPATSDTSTCAVPTNLSVTNITSSSAKLNWAAVAGAASYKVRYRVAGTSQWTTKNSNGNSISLTNLSADTKYTWQVKTNCTNGSSDWSAKKNFTTAALRIGDESLQQTSFQIYPNPTDGTFTLDLEFNSEPNTAAVIQVLNMTGQVVYDKTTIVVNGALQKEIQLPDAAADGTYLVKVIVSDRVYSAQINYQK